jgi:hypothetical protein
MLGLWLCDPQRCCEPASRTSMLTHDASPNMCDPNRVAGHPQLDQTLRHQEYAQAQKVFFELVRLGDRRRLSNHLSMNPHVDLGAFDHSGDTVRIPEPYLSDRFLSAYVLTVLFGKSWAGATCCSQDRAGTGDRLASGSECSDLSKSERSNACRGCAGRRPR